MLSLVWVFMKTMHIMAMGPSQGISTTSPVENCDKSKMVISKTQFLNFSAIWYLPLCIGFHSTLRWRHNDHSGVSNHQPRGCLLNRLFRRKSKKTSKLRVTGLRAGNSPGTGEFPAQMPVTRKMLPFDDVIMKQRQSNDKERCCFSAKPLDQGEAKNYCWSKPLFAYWLYSAM